MRQRKILPVCLSAFLIALVSGAAVGVAQAQSATAPKTAEVKQAQPVSQPLSQATIDQFLRVRAPQGATLGTDGTLYVRDLADGITQVFKVVPAATATGGRDYSPGKATMTKLTSYADGVSGTSMSPDGKTLLITHAVGGNENFQIAAMDIATGKITDITKDPRVQYSITTWLDDGSGFVYSGNQDSPNDFHLYLWDFKKGEAQKILGREGSWSCGDVTKDRTRALVSKFQSASDTQVFELDIATGKTTEITIKPEGSTANCEVVGYLPGEEAVLLTSDAKDGMVRLYRKDLKTGAVTSPIPSLDKYELDGAGFNTEKTLLVAVTNEDGYGVARVFEAAGMTPLAMPETARGVVGGGGTFRGRTLVWTLNNAQTPGLAYETTWGADGKPETKPLTFADTQGIDLSSFPLPDLVKYKSFDGVEIPAFVFFPPGYDKAAKKPIPFICLYHGGPEGQHRPTFSAQSQYFLSRGFGIMLPNVRGSTGYGRDFHMMDDYKKRWDSVKDGVEAAKWLVDNGYAVPGKITTYGGSYGGFMSVACLVEDTRAAEQAKRQPYFGAGVNIVGIVNLKTFLEKTSGYRRKLREAEYGPLTDPDFLMSVSSINKTEFLRVPMFIAHGFNDPRVPVEEAMQLAVALKDKAFAEKKPELMPQLLVFPDEGHGFAKLDNRLLFAKQVESFMQRTIGNKSAAAVPEK
ncbi:MAG: prolyl oligopeptidase family serine peptidase [Tepidisphaera sp.]